jgi:hypothetical protein
MSFKRYSRILLNVILVPYYLYVHKIKFGITNTKFDISFCVFRESFLQDQYMIKKFCNDASLGDEIFFLDLGRNHGFVFLYFIHHLFLKNALPKRIRYVGIDPSPLKFCFYDDRKLKSLCEIKYNIIDRAIIFGNESTVKLKYGESNFGNFNISGSNYEQKTRQGRRKFNRLLK